MSLKFRILIFLFLTLWLLGIFYEWVLKTNILSGIAYPIVKRTYSLVCHQDLNKLIEFNNHKTLLCSRCTGIYSGAFIISFFMLFSIRVNLPSLKIFITIILITLFDVLASTIGLYHYSRNIAFITGLLLGSIGFLYFYFGLKQFIDEFSKGKI